MRNYGSTTYQVEQLEYNTLENDGILSFELTKLNVAVHIQNRHTRKGMTMEEIAPYLNFTAAVVNIDPRKEPTLE